MTDISQMTSTKAVMMTLRMKVVIAPTPNRRKRAKKEITVKT
jgi:hypothetical protein